MAKFKKGDRVLCVNDVFKGTWPIIYPKLMEVYTIERVLYDGAVTLCEIDFSPVEKVLVEQGTFPEPGFWPWHFIKIDEMLDQLEYSAMESDVKSH